ncbi:MAG: Virion structural protein [uncultured bacterium]|nr:MAG: Virion structural protein [uncultured bacterium]
MTFNIPVLDLDISGTNLSNRIIDESHDLSNRPVRSIAANYGPFFAESLIIKDGSNILSRGTDYQLVELQQEATLRYGKEIVSVILIINSSINSNVTITYQSLGGHFVHNDFAVANLYQSVISDNRPINWNEVFNKPAEFNPVIHRHLLDDVYGFEPVVDGLERIKRAITLGQTSIVLEIVNSLLGKFVHGEIPIVIPNEKIVQYDSLLYVLSKRKILSNATIDVLDSTWHKGDSVRFEIDTIGMPIGLSLYWELYKPGNNISLFSVKNGYVTSNNNKIYINLYIPAALNIQDYPLYLGLKYAPSDPEYLAVSYKITVDEIITTTSALGFMINSPSDSVNNAHLFASDYDVNDELRTYYLATNY